MLSPQTTMFLLLGITMAMFIWCRFRFDIVAFSALLFAAVLGLVPAGSTFSGFGHPAVITVAAVLVISRALQNSGVIDLMTSRLGVLSHSPLLHIGALSAAAALLSAADLAWLPGPGVGLSTFPRRSPFPKAFCSSAFFVSQSSFERVGGPELGFGAGGGEACPFFFLLLLTLVR